MIVKALIATAAFATIVIGYLVMSVPITQVGNATIASFPGISLNGVSVATFVANQFALFGAAITLGIIAVVIWFYAAVSADEEDTGSFD